ncbi:2-dehydropantoate 2-reductase [Acuticoccus sediminis]|uniref:2-dehydropantoate 2-reductase n=1 Tax=Acuticoccus sediminis TaxID=2184697 RepID=A0A8B2NI44_9HYPH|nr:2-dehydropantoate 2-reductase [Acuticoccus sediminis]RAH96711.1 2-dehydropantoate 2-reductase [Acuticoccus sediminis]
MRILVLGAGGIGGYFGGRLAAAGRDVTFLVRPRRAEMLRERGLSISSPLGDVHLAMPSLVTADQLAQPYDLVILSCKAYDLEDAMRSLAPSVGSETAILPLLNGVAHIELLEQQFGASAVLGGTCYISTTAQPDGTIVHMNDMHRLTLGDRTGVTSSRVEAIHRQLSGAGFDAVLSDRIVQNMWDKWVFIASSAGMTCLMRSSIGDYVSAGATSLASQLVDECVSVATAAGHSLDDAEVANVRSFVTKAGSTIKTSMLRDIENGAPIEADQIIGDMVRRAASFSLPTPILSVVQAHLKSYEIGRARRLAA